MPVIPLPAFHDNYIWVITEENSDHFACVDPGIADPVIAYATKHNKQLTHILITHHHEDHIGGIQDLLTLYPQTIVYGPSDSRIPQITSPLLGGEYLSLFQTHYHILKTPGHTSTHISYYEPILGLLFCGDTLFSAGCGRVFDGMIGELYHSIETLKTLPNDTLVYCAHEYTLQNLAFADTVEPKNTSISYYKNKILTHQIKASIPSTIALEKKVNPFMRTQEPDVISFAHQHGARSDTPLEIFTILREQKNKFVPPQK